MWKNVLGLPKGIRIKIDTQPFKKSGCEFLFNIRAFQNTAVMDQMRIEFPLSIWDSTKTYIEEPSEGVYP